jgi:hypothetical protein
MTQNDIPDILFKLYSKADNQVLMEINEYKYDTHNNIIEINRSSEPNQDYPIFITGGRFRYENEKYRYIYNDDGLWTAQYRTVENKEMLITRREFK